MSRRDWRAMVAATVALATWSGAASAAEMKVTLLGTGTPTSRLGRFSASTPVEAGSEKLLFDLGRGATIRLFQKRMRSVRSRPTSSPICIPTTSSACPTCS